MEQQFLSLSKAEKHIGKSRSTLRRFVEGITKPENHPDRHLIKPSATEVAEFHKNNHPFSWRISVELLDREFKQEGAPAKETPVEENQSPAIDLLQQTIGMLKTELDEKNRQIAQFQERDRETNILLQQTTEKLVLLTEGKNRPAHKTEDAVTVEPSSKQESDGSSSKRKDQKDSLWQRFNKPLFSRK